MVIEKYSVSKIFAENEKMMKIFGLLPIESFPLLFKPYAYFWHFAFVIPVPILATYKIMLADPDVRMIKITENVFLISQLGVQIIKLLPFKRNPSDIKGTIDVWKSDIFNMETELDEEIIIEANKKHLFMYKFFLFLCYLGNIVFLIRTIISPTRQLFIDIWTPFDAVNDTTHFILVAGYLHLNLFHSALTNVCADTLIAGFMLQSATQLKLMKHRLQNMDQYLKIELGIEYLEFDDPVIRDLVYRNISKCVEIHNSVLEFIKKVEKTFSVVVFSQFFGSMIVLGISLLQMSKLNPISVNFLALISFLMPITVEIFLYCYYGTILHEESATIGTAIFKSAWYKYDARSKKLLMILNESAKRPIQLTAGKILDLSLETFVLILKRSYSILAMLKKF